MTRLLLINPNTTQAITTKLQALACQRSGVHVTAVTASFGSTYISSEADCAIAAHASLQVWRDAVQLGPFDAVLLGCFGDPGLFALREEAGIPVYGLAQASFAQASSHGPFGIVTGGRAWGPMLRRLAITLPEGQPLADIETVELTGAQLAADPHRGLDCLRQAALELLGRTPVRSIIIGGAGLAGMAAQLQASLPCPVIDSVEAALDEIIRR